ncbi:MAG: cadherin-like domain-containing protein, partial [Thermoguttaceae bacterium]|nr:cadherin-like domain-containing protein [Thermoguttaceae bacterium]
DWATIAQGITDANYVDSSALSGTSYSYRVSAYREGTYSSNLTSGVGVLTTSATAPTVPTGFSALRYGDEYVVATWKPSPGATSYTVLRSTDGCQTWPYVATVYDASYIDDDIEPGVTYVYRLRANNSAGHSAWTFVSGYGFGTTPASLTNGLDPTTDVALPGYDVAFTRGSNPSGLVDATLAAREGSAIVKQSAQDGTVTLNATTGAWSYAPTSATVVNGVTSGALDLFSIETFDSDGVSQDEMYVIVEAPDEPAPYAPSSTPVARADSFVVINIRTLGALSPIVLDPLENDSATSTGTLTLVSATLSNPNAGTLAVGQDSRSLEFYPAQGFTGDVSFSYTVSDSASNATTNGAASLRVTAPPSAWQPGVLALGATTVAGSTTIPTSISPTFADGSYSFVITDSADVDGVHYSATLSVVVYDRGGVYRYHETRSWTYGYVSGAISYSGGIDSDYGYSLSPVRESLKYKVSGRDVAYCRSGSQTGMLTETNDYVYTASEVNGTFRDSTYSKRTRNETGTTTTLGTEVLYGESVRVRSDAFHTSFENAIQTHETVLGVESGHYRGLGRERALVLTSGKKDVAVNDRVWEDGLTTARVGSTRINYSDTSQTTTHYTLSQDWNGSGWSV